MKQKTKYSITVLVASIFSFTVLVPKAGAWCFILPESITYGSSLNALSAGSADAIKTQVDVDDLMGGRVIMGNIYSMDTFDVILSDDTSEIAKVSLLKGQALGLTNDKLRYYIVSASPLADSSTIDDQSDVWAKGNWTYFYPNMLVEKISGISGGYLRLAPVEVQTLSRVPTQVQLKNFVRLGSEHFSRASALPNGASEAPFSTALFAEVPVVEICAYDGCEPGTGEETIPFFVSWTLKKKY